MSLEKGLGKGCKQLLPIGPFINPKRDWQSRIRSFAQTGFLFLLALTMAIAATAVWYILWKNGYHFQNDGETSVGKTALPA